ncbi:MAG TPA: DNA polymerase III subunit gamma/tau [Candidatus Dorea intestinavium]|nr:DNA polymerase III subunit gamma/tau [Candidatus Dorea intestinavium]
MSYTALYRKFRPEVFEDVKGQDAIVKTLQNQIATGRIGHAYLFCGTRGTGKTSVAKIFAKAVNCEEPVNGSPCTKCETCKNIQSGASMNVIEIDAASNNGVDNIREIREEVAYRPTEGKYKVYIIDEVHMLSIGAFNALLKTLEEPPEYVIFILATTEVHKIPVTILSRCQRYDFKRISVTTITDRLRELAAIENLDVEEKALRYIARSADGAMRDALSLLDQCVAFYFNETLTYDKVLEVLGAVDTEVFRKLFHALYHQEVKEILAYLDELIMEGKELYQLTLDFTWYLRNLLLAKSGDNVEESLDMSLEGIRRLKEEAKEVDVETIYRFIRIFSETSNKMRYSTQKRVLLEVTFIKLCKPEMEAKEDTLLDRIKALEKEVKNRPTVIQEIETTNTHKVEEAPKQKTVSKELMAAIPEEVKEVAKDFRNIIEGLPGSKVSYLKMARLSVGENGALLIVIPDPIGVGFLRREEDLEEIKNHIENKIGKSIQLEIRGMDENRAFEEQYVDFENIINMEIKEEDF